MTEQGKVHYLLVRGYEEFHVRMSGLEFIPLGKMQLLHMRENMLRWKEKRREIWKPLRTGYA